MSQPWASNLPHGSNETMTSGSEGLVHNSFSPHAVVLELAAVTGCDSYVTVVTLLSI